MASMLRGTVPPMQRRLQQLSDTAAASASQHQLRCRAERAESIAFVDRRLRRGHSNSFPPSPSPAPLSAAAASPSSSRRPAAVAASASRRAAAAAAAVVEAAPPSLLDPAVAALEAIKAFFASPLSPPPLPSSLAAALAAAAALPPARRDALAALATAIGAYALVKFFDRVATKGWLDQKLTRKLVHTLAGPLFVASWSLFSASDSARWFAAAVPFLNGLRLVLAGTGITSSEGSVRSMTRHGDRAELLRGPLYYVLALVVATLLFWRVSPISACAVAAMCGGDGLADIVGRRSPPGSPRIPWNKDKTLRGSSAMFAASLAFAVALVWLFTGFGYFAVVGGGGGADAAAASVVATAAAAASHSPSASASASAASSSLYSALFASFSAERAAAFALAPPTLAALAAVAFAATAVESLPANAFVDDNVSVPAVAMALGWWLFERSC